jgi:hypothetical protein
MMIKNQTDQTNEEKRNQPTHLRVTRKRISSLTVRPWLVFHKLRLISTKQTRHPAGAVEAIATTP